MEKFAEMTGEIQETKQAGLNKKAHLPFQLKQKIFMSGELHGKKVAILATDGFEQSELLEPRKALNEAGAETKIVSLKDNVIKAWDGTNWGETVKVDLPLKNANAKDFDALVLPGGVMNPDKLRMNNEAVEFVRKFFESGKPIAAICHGPQILIDADVVRGRKLTSYPSIKNDLINAGAEWFDKVVVTDQGLVTSRRPDDLPEFNKKMIEEFKEGVHEQRLAA